MALLWEGGGDSVAESGRVQEATKIIFLIKNIFCSNKILRLMSVCLCIVDDMKRVKLTRCYTVVY
jgi:hypothetical protein